MGWMPLEDDWAGAVGDDSAGAMRNDSADAVKGEGAAVGDEGVGIRYVESIKRKLLHTSVQLVRPPCSLQGRPPFTRVPRKCRSGSTVRSQVRRLGNQLAARSAPGPPSEILHLRVSDPYGLAGRADPRRGPTLQNHGGSVRVWLRAETGYCGGGAVVCDGESEARSFPRALELRQGCGWEASLVLLN